MHYYYAGPCSPPSKKIRISHNPSDLQPKVVDSRGYMPCAYTDRENVAFYTGRQHAVPLNIAPPSLLCVPEFGLVYDSVMADPQFVVEPSTRIFQVGGSNADTAVFVAFVLYC